MWELVVRLAADVAVVPVVLLGLWAFAVYAPKGRRYEFYCRVLMAGLTAYLLAKCIGVLYQPAGLRPYELLGVTPGASYLENPGFPSDHALFVGAIACAVTFGVRRSKLSIAMWLLVVIVSIGRVLALVHTPLDVVAGVAIALVGSVWYIGMPKIEKHKKNNVFAK